MTATAAAAVAAAAAAATATSLSDSATLGPRFTGVGVLLPTVFLGLVVLGVLVVLGASLAEVVLPSGLGRAVVFESTALLAVGFFVAGADFAVDFGTSCLAGFGAGLGRA